MDNKASVADLLVEFMEAVVHQIIYIREIYDAELFERQKLYGVAVKRARHPELCEYIHVAMHSLKDALIQGNLYKVAVVVVGPDHQPVERHIIEPRVLVPQNAPEQPPAAGARQLHDAEAQLRGFLLKLQYMDQYLDKPPPGCTFEVVAYTAGRMGMPITSWAEEQQGTGSLELNDGEIVPVKTCRMDDAFQLQVYTERDR